MSTANLKGNYQIASTLTLGPGLRQTSALAFFLLALLALSGCSNDSKPQGSEPPQDQHTPGPSAQTGCASIVSADVVALEQAYLLNRFAAFVPAGMMYALSSDVVYDDPDTEQIEQLSLSKSKLQDPAFARKIAGKVKLRSSKRPRPLVLRVNQGDCLDVTFTNLFPAEWHEDGGIPKEYAGKLPQHVESRAGAPASRQLVAAEKVSKDAPRTRAASFHVNGLEYVPIEAKDCPENAVCGGDGSNVGLRENQGLIFNPKTSEQVRNSFALGSLVLPGQRAMLRMKGSKEGTYFAYSTAAPVGGEGDGGQLGLGLFAAVNIEPAGSHWYRSQVTSHDLQEATGTPGDAHHPYAKVDYDKTRDGIPILAMLDTQNNIVHSDLNAIVVQKEPKPGSGEEKTQQDVCGHHMFGDSCGAAFREFTVIMHDEVHAEQAFAELADETNPLHYIKDGMGINYGVSSMGSLVMGSQSQRAVGVVAKCPECRAEEFFLSSWANGDPALILKWDDEGEKPVGAMYPDDPSNVHHSYLGDPVRFRNIHAGPKETHVFHLHAHQWVLDASDPNSTYLDSQTISPGATFSYGIEFGGSGNRNYTPGDSIFHCHLYPHFAQGMWELWRVHDTFQDGMPGLYHPDKPVSAGNNPRWRNLPDAEVAQGVETPALVPLPGTALAPIATASFPGYPFYIPGEAGHRPPQPPLDMDVNDPNYLAKSDQEPDPSTVVNGGLPRHVVTGQNSTLKHPDHDPAVIENALSKGGQAAQLIARRAYEQNRYALTALAREWGDLHLKTLQHRGEDGERAAMAFHEGFLPANDTDLSIRREPVTDALPPHEKWWQGYSAYRTEWANTVKDQNSRDGMDPLFHVNGQPRAQGAPYANPCPSEAPQRHYRAAFIQTELTVNRHGWFDPQGRIVILENDIKDIIDPQTRSRLPEPLFFRANSGECIDFKSSNFVPSALNVDDFQVYTPTDTIGQHIHLVKFDVTSSDGSGNGWNYEDTTFSPDEVRERIFAHRRTSGDKSLKPKAHPLFLPGGDIYEHRNEPRYSKLYEKGRCPDQNSQESDHDYEGRLNKHHPLCGAQRTTQRWWADPILVEQRDADGKATGKFRDNTLRTVFSHDHMGPSSHQQHGLYSGLVIEPANSTWSNLDAALSKEDLIAVTQSGPASEAAREKLLGGSDLTRPPLPAIAAAPYPLSAIAPRDPLKLREDGGPTATMANIIAPGCIGDPDSHPLQPESGRQIKEENSAKCAAKTEQTRREFTVAIADFATVYNVGLEPINPETRDVSALRFGQRQVATQLARPLGIASEDPGTQLVNYRNEPLALRIADVKLNKQWGGFDYSQHPCADGAQSCQGDLANGFASHAHVERDRALAGKSYTEWTATQAGVKADEIDMVSPTTRGVLKNAGLAKELRATVTDIEQWRQDFICALYPEKVFNTKCREGIERREPWRTFGDPATPILAAYEYDPIQIRLIQGAQEAQHVFAMTGVKWHRMPANSGSGFVNTQPLGISEHFEFDINTPFLDAPQVDYLYYGSSVDQLWDGMWGLMRVCGSGKLSPSCAWSEHIAKLPGIKEVPGRSETDAKEMVCHDSKQPRRYFDVSAARVCDLYGNCDKPQQTGLTYNKRYGIEDLKAIIYVLSYAGNQKRPDDLSNDAVLEQLKNEFSGADGKSPRPLEPLVLRANAGQCLEITLRNHLPASAMDGLPFDADKASGEVADAYAYHNFLPMITDGFNVNQVRMSSSIGLAAPRVSQHPLHHAGSNVGLNAVNSGNVSGSTVLPGSLAPPCTESDRQRGRDDKCQVKLIWSATDYRGDSNEAVEFGALPLTSLADPIKHPMHGLVGALVIGPLEARLCPAGSKNAKECRSVAEANNPQDPRSGSQLSARICKPDGQCYLDQILVMQDAVSATSGSNMGGAENKINPTQHFPVPNLSGAEEPDDYGVKAINYKTEPLWARRGNDPSIDFAARNEQDYATVFSSERKENTCVSGIPLLAGLGCDPETPIFKSVAGETIRLHFVHPGGHTRQQGLTVHGHAWNPYPWSKDSRTFDSASGSAIRQGTFNGFGPMMGITLEMQAGGENKVPMDYLLHSQASFLLDGGLWGLVRVEPASPSR